MWLEFGCNLEALGKCSKKAFFVWHMFGPGSEGLSVLSKTILQRTKIVCFATKAVALDDYIVASFVVRRLCIDPEALKKLGSCK